MDDCGDCDNDIPPPNLIAVIVTVKNEAPHLWEFLMSLVKQTRRPDLVVVTVAPSTDKTLEILRNFRCRFITLPFDYCVVEGNRSKGRNAGVRMANEKMDVRSLDPIIVFTNVCVLDEHWLENLVQPIIEGDADVVGGAYHIDAKNDKERALGLVTQFSPEEMESDSFYPAALNMAIVHSLGDCVEWFDENLDTSEDTDFILRVKKLNVAAFKFQPDAIVKWRPSTLTPEDAVRTYYEYAVTDGLGGLLKTQYGTTYLVYGLGLGLTQVSTLMGIFFFSAWFLFRTRKVIKAKLEYYLPIAMLTVLGMDVARMVGYARGYLARLTSPTQN